MKKLIAGIATICVLALIVMTLIHNKAQSTAKAEAQREVITALPVTVATVDKGTLADVLALTGTIAANNDITVVSETSGRIKSVNVKVGDYVQAGTTLVQVDDELRQANLLSAQANFDKAKADFDRTEALHKEQAVADAQLDAARLGLKAAEAQLIIARRQMRDTRVSSPISGIITARPVDVGTMLQNGTPVATVVDISSLKVKVSVGEADVFKMKVGDQVTITTEVYPGVAFAGRIANISVKGDEAHTYPVEITLSNSKEHPLRAGMFARVAFTAIQPIVSPVIPREALLGSVKDARVYVVEGKTARLRSIVVGAETDGKVSVLRGLREGETLVVNGQNNLRDGVEVNIVR
jgi:RND family efflux transporter MFP subunit